MTDAPELPRTRRLLRFSVKILLILAFITAGLVAGYRDGFDRGYAEEDLSWLSRKKESFVARTYVVGDLLSATRSTDETSTSQTLNFGPLIELIRDTIDTSSWYGVGGHGDISGVTQTKSLVIRQRPSAHAEIAGLLDALRSDRLRNAADPRDAKRQRKAAVAEIRRLMVEHGVKVDDLRRAASR